ncbi:MAG: alpha-E domain-containing protein [Thiolinea sp.]
MMLSSVAERVYWMSRYLERTENVARLANVHSLLLMDLPGEMEINWYTLIKLFDADKLFYEHYDRASEENVMRFLLADRENPGSLASTFWYVRENVRTSLDLLPDATWEQVNQTHIIMNNSMASLTNRHARQNLLRTLLRQAQTLRGIIDGHMSRNHTFLFIQAGKYIERTDMTSRILEMASLLLSKTRSDNLRKYEGILWTNLLQALSARQMYQQQVRSRVRGSDVLPFLMMDEAFPRSLYYTLTAIGRFLEQLPEPEIPLVMQQRLLEHLQQQDIPSLLPDGQVHTVMDYLQGELGLLHAEIAKTWFYPDRNDQQQLQSQS